MALYDPKSPCADEFINHQEIVDTLAYAEAHKDDLDLCKRILAKAHPNVAPKKEHCTCITHREAAVLLLCDDPGINAEIKQLARQIKLAYYGNRIVLFAPLYLSNYCVNGCLYCPYHAKNRTIPRRKLTQDEIRAEVIALQDMGHKRLAIEAGEDPKFIARRMVIFASEDIGLAGNGALSLATACFQAVERVGMPESGLISHSAAPSVLSKCDRSAADAGVPLRKDRIRRRFSGSIAGTEARMERPSASSSTPSMTIMFFPLAAIARSVCVKSLLGSAVASAVSPNSSRIVPHSAAH